MRNAKVDFNIIEPEVKEEVTVVSTC
jgi:hypothetical protein